MSYSRHVSAAVLVSTALLWALVMTVGGAWCLTLGRARFAAFSDVLAASGVFWIVGGQLVFAILVADRVFPRAARRVVVPMEILLTLSVFAAGVWTVYGLWVMLAAARAGGPM
ncbi:MAG: hypothetical protein AAF747_10750 [Planctomycetota bacterium]